MDKLRHTDSLYISVMTIFFGGLLIIVKNLSAFFSCEAGYVFGMKRKEREDNIWGLL